LSERPRENSGSPPLAPEHIPAADSIDENGISDCFFSYHRPPRALYRNISSHGPSTKVREIVPVLKAIYASEVWRREKTLSEWSRSWQALRLTRAAELAYAAVEETQPHYAFPKDHWGAPAPTIRSQAASHRRYNHRAIPEHRTAEEQQMKGVIFRPRWPPKSNVRKNLGTLPFT
jgi:hypothetical protein